MNVLNYITVDNPFFFFMIATLIVIVSALALVYGLGGLILFLISWKSKKDSPVVQVQSYSLKTLDYTVIRVLQRSILIDILTAAGIEVDEKNTQSILEKKGLCLDVYDPNTLRQKHPLPKNTTKQVAHVFIDIGGLYQLRAIASSHEEITFLDVCDEGSIVFLHDRKDD